MRTAPKSATNTLQGLTRINQKGKKMRATDYDTPTSVYLYFDRDQMLLYVGITKRGARRQGEHSATKTWWPHVDSQNVEHYPSRKEAEDREKWLIKTFTPPFNIVHNNSDGDPATRYLDSLDSSRSGELKRDLILNRSIGQGDGSLFTSGPSDAKTVSALDMSSRNWNSPRKHCRVRGLHRLGATLAVFVEEKRPISVIRVILKEGESDKSVRLIKHVEPLYSL